jgi:hypothetical protein
MDRRDFFGTVGALCGLGVCKSEAKPKALKTPWHSGPYIVEIWKPYSNPTIYNYTAFNRTSPVEFDNLKQASNWANARRSFLVQDNVTAGKILIKTTDGSVVQSTIWGPSWTTTTVYVDGPPADLGDSYK